MSHYSEPFAGISLDFIFVGHASVDDSTYGDNRAQCMVRCIVKLRFVMAKGDCLH